MSGAASLTGLVDELASRAQPLMVFRAPEIGRLYEVIRSEQHTVPTAATLMWQAVMATPDFAKALAQVSYGRGPAAALTWPPDALIVPHTDWDRFSLVVFDPTRDSDAPQPFEIRPDPDAVLAAVAALRRRIERSAKATPLALALDPALIASLATQAPLSGLLLRAPDQETLSTFAPAVPVGLSGGQVASAGILARRAQGNRIGITTARHLFAEAGLGPVPGVTQADVMGITAVVEAADAFSDCAFLLPDDDATDFANLLPHRAVAGLLAGMTPRQNETMSFEGSVSGAQQTVVRGWSPELPWVMPDMQMRVVTDRVTAPGDSGAALLDASGHVCGFAYRATKWGVKPEISSWIWADSALQALDLTLHP